MLKSFLINPHKTLVRLVTLNIIFDVVAVAVWAVFPAVQWSIYRLGFSIVGTEAALAAAVFGLTLLFGLRKKQKWAPLLVIAVTVTQRVFATYVFFPSPAIALTLVWSLILIFFAYLDYRKLSSNIT
jgi:hypothetical protein